MEKKKMNNKRGGVILCMVGWEEVVAFMLMVVMEGCTIGLTIMASTIMSRGMSPLVFVVYTSGLSSFLLLPYNSLFHLLPLPKSNNNNIGDDEDRGLTWSLLKRFIFLGFTGITMAQNLAYVGLSYSSPILACGMGNLLPSFSFLLSILCRTTKVDWKSPSTRAKLGGTMVSIIGAVSLTLYKGSPIKQYNSSTLLHHRSLFIFSSKNEHWVLGAIFLASSSLTFSIWNIIQVGTLKECPQAMTIASSYSLVGTILSSLLAILIERKPSAWRLDLNMQLLVIILTAIFGSVIRNGVHMWCIRTKGPFYVTMFKPLGIPIASMCGCLFFANTFHYGSIMGASMVGVGYYMMIWAQMKEDEANISGFEETKVPLLQEDQV